MKRILASVGIVGGSVTPAPQSGATTPDSKTSEKRKLANTGYSALIAGAFAILLVLFGAGIYSVSRKDN